MARETRYDIVSAFPNDVDDLLFLSDIDLDHLQESSYHNELANAQLYSQAGDYLEKTATMDSFCASLFNLLNNRIYALQDYLKSNLKHSRWYTVYGVESPFVYGEEPENKEQTPVWVELIDEDTEVSDG